MSKLAILCGGGNLPPALAEAHPDAHCVVFDGVAHAMRGNVHQHRFEEMGALFAALHEAGVTKLVMAGALGRPALDPTRFDAGMMAIAPRLLPALQGGDDAILRLIIAVFEEQGFEVVGAHSLLPGICAEEGLIAGPAPSDAALSDATRAVSILDTLSPLDVGQGVVVAAGLCLGIETLQGTDALLRFVGETPQSLRRGKGVFVKAPKRGQDLRVDMPAIGPATVDAAAAAGVEGIVVDAGKVMIIDREETLAALARSGLFLMGRVL
ncbi:UDP-2,3-diacylglucosamine diphosphatase LpxI [Shimia sp. R10_1]|uniref:LpxI family protein n=1 Tax=Shimia sp. R10_1 TaxID=2821095 RepID=UPI001ADB169B|nr:UDP-2,3-diacylglucosamine diphosphatase LpxI [Shimia sp. R10_1]MBO9473328.1 UDP-2,3-diacylglucosamine diphosphatase LpxI [Shimia sp. R10_1]